MKTSDPKNMAKIILANPDLPVAFYCGCDGFLDDGLLSRKVSIWKVVVDYVTSDIDEECVYLKGEDIDDLIGYWMEHEAEDGEEFDAKKFREWLDSFEWEKMVIVMLEAD